jgi:hypothetical protein
MAEWKKVGYCYPSGLEKTLCKWDIYVPLVTKGLIKDEIRVCDKRHDDDCDSDGDNGDGGDATLISAAMSTSVRQWK